MDGFNMLGADTAQPQVAQVQSMLQQLQTTAPKLDLKDPQMQRAWNATTYMIAGSAIGAVVGGVGLAALWASHRVIGFLLGFILVGPSAGAGVGYAIGQAKAVK